MKAKRDDAPTGEGRGVSGAAPGTERVHDTADRGGRPDGRRAAKERHRYGPVPVLRIALHAMTNPAMNRAAVAALGALLQNVNRDTGTCWPSLDTITESAGIKQRSTTVKALKAVERERYIARARSRGGGGGARSTTRYRVLLNCDHKATANCDAADTAKCVESRERTVSGETHELASKREPSERATSLMTLDEYFDHCDAQGRQPIEDHHEVVEFVKTIGPRCFLIAAWAIFVSRHEESTKRRNDWPAYFLRSVREDWLGAWRKDRNGTFRLTTRGEMALENWNKGD